jgi:hypothetical protein
MGSERALRARLFGAAAGDPQGDHSGVLGSFLVDGFALDEKHLTYLGKVEVAATSIVYTQLCGSIPA